MTLESLDQSLPLCLPGSSSPLVNYNTREIRTSSRSTNDSRTTPVLSGPIRFLPFFLYYSLPSLLYDSLTHSPYFTISLLHPTSYVLLPTSSSPSNDLPPITHSLSGHGGVHSSTQGRAGEIAIQVQGSPPHSLRDAQKEIPLFVLLELLPNYHP